MTLDQFLTYRTLGIYICSVFVAHVVGGIILYLMRLATYKFGTDEKDSKGRIIKKRPVVFMESFEPMNLWVGGVERLVATTLVVWWIAYLPAFIGGWIALKFAANWKRFRNDTIYVREGSLMSLVGSVISIAMAIVAGVAIYPDAIAHLAK